MEGYRQDVGRAASSMSVPSDLSDCSPRALIRKDPFTNWVELETARCGGNLPRRLVNMQLVAWLSCVQVALSRRRLPSCGRCAGKRRNSRLCRRRLVASLPLLCRDLICDFVGDQTGASITASSLRVRVNNVRLQDISGTLFHEFRKAADQGLTSYYLNQNIKLISFWRPWMLEADGPAWIRSCLASRGFKTEICKVYHTAYAGVQGCSFFELKVSW
ncbi:unnamed protein product [Durusdinium trenchii]|uniref:Uncharacterized protein n=2 Tax=Durusdinium trenchii TaxID=1381693 RepID=A0ABP0LI16_9DINO